MTIRFKGFEKYLVARREVFQLCGLFGNKHHGHRRHVERFDIAVTDRDFVVVQIDAANDSLCHGLRQGEVLPRSLIASLVWDMNFDSDTNVIEVAMRRLRAKVDEGFEVRLIQTVRGMGYVLEASQGA